MIWFEGNLKRNPLMPILAKMDPFHTVMEISNQKGGLRKILARCSDDGGFIRFFCRLYFVENAMAEFQNKNNVRS